MSSVTTLGNTGNVPTDLVRPVPSVRPVSPSGGEFGPDNNPLEQAGNGRSQATPLDRASAAPAGSASDVAGPLAASSAVLVQASASESANGDGADAGPHDHANDAAGEHAGDALSSDTAGANANSEEGEGDGPNDLTPEEEAQVEYLKERDLEVRQHEQAHARVGGQFAGAPQYETERGPDGRTYAVGGSVQIDVAPVEGDPEATVRKAETVRRAALAPAEPSAQDHKVAAQATQLQQEAQRELSEERQDELTGETEDGEPTDDAGGDILGIAAGQENASAGDGANASGDENDDANEGSSSPFAASVNGPAGQTNEAENSNRAFSASFLNQANAVAGGDNALAGEQTAFGLNGETGTASATVQNAVSQQLNNAVAAYANAANGANQSQVGFLNAIGQPVENENGIGGAGDVGGAAAAANNRRQPGQFLNFTA